MLATEKTMDTIVALCKGRGARYAMTREVAVSVPGAGGREFPLSMSDFKPGDKKYVQGLKPLRESFQKDSLPSGSLKRFCAS